MAHEFDSGGIDSQGYKERLLGETRDELAKADGKASILLAASGIAATALLTVGSTASWYPGKLKHAPAPLLAWLAVGFTVAGIMLIGAAVKPRLRPGRRGTVPHYFGDVEAYYPRWWQWRSRKRLLQAGRHAFDAAIGQLPPDEYEKRLEDQIWILSHSAYRKYRFVAAGIWLFGMASVAALAAFLIENRGV